MKLLIGLNFKALKSRRAVTVLFLLAALLVMLVVFWPTPDQLPQEGVDVTLTDPAELVSEGDYAAAAEGFIRIADTEEDDFKGQMLEAAGDAYMLDRQFTKAAETYKLAQAVYETADLKEDAARAKLREDIARTRIENEGEGKIQE